MTKDVALENKNTIPEKIYKYDRNNLNSTVEIPEDENVIECWSFDEALKKIMSTEDGKPSIKVKDIIEKIIIKKNEKRISLSAFNKLKNLKIIEIDKDNDYFDGDGQTVYQKDINANPSFIWCSKEKEGDYVMPPHIRIIAGEAFKNCKKLKSITFGDVGQFMSDDVFKGCKKIIIKAPKYSGIIMYAKACGLKFEEITY